MLCPPPTCTSTQCVGCCAGAGARARLVADADTLPATPCLPACRFQAVEQELLLLKDRVQLQDQKQQQQQLEHERELEAARTREREQREKEREREAREREQERDGEGQGEAGRKRDRGAGSELQGHAGGVKAARDARSDAAHSAGAADAGGQRAARGKEPLAAEADPYVTGVQGVPQRRADGGGYGIGHGSGAATAQGVCAERDAAAWEMEQIDRCAVLTNTSAERLRVVKALLSAWYVAPALLLQRSYSLCVATVQPVAICCHLFAPSSLCLCAPKFAARARQRRAKDACRAAKDECRACRAVPAGTTVEGG